MVWIVGGVVRPEMGSHRRLYGGTPSASRVGESFPRLYREGQKDGDIQGLRHLIRPRH
jgi:hypothetical protein